MRVALSFLFGSLICLTLVRPLQAQTPLEARLYVSGLVAPIGFEQDPANPRVQFVVQQGGIIRTIVDGVLQATPFLDMSDMVVGSGECGLLGLAFPPDTVTTRRFYVHYNTIDGPDQTCATRIARVMRSAGNPLIADKASLRDFRWPSGDFFIAHPFSNHKGGQIAFGPDGYLYIGIGDGGSANDPGHAAQDKDLFRGKILRLDVSVANSDPGYAVPPDNPFVDNNPVAALHEIWAFGMRNPWRFSFDSVALGGTGALIIGDVGQSAREEVDYEPANHGGRNYGWRNFEGTRVNEFHTDLPLAYEPKTDPVFEYGRNDGGTVIGGYVYRGTALGARFRGRYFFGDFVSGRIWSLGLSINSMTGEATALDRIEHTAELSTMQSLGAPTSFGRDAAGELYIVSYAGYVFKIGRMPFTSPVLVQPTAGSAIDQTPTFRWRPVIGATGYQLWVNDSTGTRINTWYNAAQLQCGTECAVTPAVQLAEGPVTWWVRGWNAEQSEGPWSAGVMATRVAPSAPTLISPSGSTGASPAFVWTAVPEMTHYYLWINDALGHRFDRWYGAAEANCPDGLGSCAVRPAITLSGSGLWWVQTWSAARGYSHWSAGMSFRRAPPAAPDLLQPRGAISTALPEYRWQAVANATHYLLWVNDSTGNKIQTWYNMSQLGCSSVGTVCAITPSTAVAAGSSTWWVQAWSADAGFGAWSTGVMFSR